MSRVDSVRRLALGSVKAVVESSLASFGIPSLARARRRSDALVLAYHNVVPEGEQSVGDLSLHLSQSSFAQQLDSLQATHDVVPLGALLEPASGRRPRAAITFDDAYLGAVTVGIQEVVRRGLTATVFVTPAFVGGGSFWWDAIADPRLGCVAPDLRLHCLQALRGRQEEILAWAADRGVRRNRIPPHQLVASEQALSSAAAHPGITLASHSWSHQNLASLGGSDLEEELQRPMVWLEDRFESVLPWITYPYGLCSPDVEAAARRAGYVGAYRVDGGWLGSRSVSAAPFALPRMNVPAGLSLRGFELRAAGLRL